MANVTIRYWAAAREAAGVAEEPVQANTLAGALAAATARRGDDSRLATVFARSSFLIDSTPVGKRPASAVQLAEGAVIEVLPPFAGG